MISAAPWRGSLIDKLVPGAEEHPASHAPARDVATLALGALLVALSLWLDIRYLGHQATTLAGVRVGARSLVGNTVLALLFVAMLAAGTRSVARTLWRDVALIAGGTLLLALAAHVVMYLPGNPVPITGQTFAVLLLAATLGWRRGYTTMALYVTLGSAGLPVFADVTSPVTYGYLAGFALAALAVGWLAERGWDRGFHTAVAAMLLGEAAIYLGGVPWLAHFTGWSLAVRLGLVPFLVGDTLKLLAAALLLPGAWLLTGRAKRLEVPG
ncbi:MAG TPA: biotin transporter BioY [Ktedonobacterales bacterium]|nr:biotin transporter BioY [Ktedonobacterales bacterium]